MKAVVFCHSLTSDFGHGAAHFLRGVVGELQAAGHAVDVYEPEEGWSRKCLLADQGHAALVAFATRFPALRSRRYRPGEPNLDRALAGADVVLVDEWTDPALVAAIGAHRATRGTYRLLLHDGHHRALADRPGWDALELHCYDAALVGDAALAEAYAGHPRCPHGVHLWPGAADLRVLDRRDRSAGFEPPPLSDLVWIGDFPDHEEEILEELLLHPIRSLNLRATIYGVRYPARARTALARAGADYRGYLPDHAVPWALVRARVTIALPRRAGPPGGGGADAAHASAAPPAAAPPPSYPFAALACGVPVVSAAPDDGAALFEPGRDFLPARSGREMAAQIAALLADAAKARALALQGRATVLARHTCAHRVAALLEILRTLDVREAA
ncbi:MAG TPA: glycosyltransferase [Polyangia bacterium]|nr:glycosyltransferase [Polyangia bacterium]